MDEDFQHLALSFPTIRHNCPGIADAIKLPGTTGTHAMLECLEKWLKLDIEEAERQAALFILNLWRRSGRGVDWPAFDLYEALGVWDDEHRMAFQVWVLRPWRP